MPDPKFVPKSYLESRAKSEPVEVEVGGALVPLMIEQGSVLIDTFDLPGVAEALVANRGGDVLGWTLVLQDRDVDHSRVQVWRAEPPERCPPPEGGPPYLAMAHDDRRPVESTRWLLAAMYAHDAAAGGTG